jgi:hypothetical protein
VKKIILFSVFLLVVSIASAQDNAICDSLYLKTAVNIKSSDPCLLIATDYVLANPLFGNTTLYYNYIGFILSWMDKTPEYTFTLNNRIIELCKNDNILLFNVYITCLAKAAIETNKDFVPQALKLFAKYLEMPDNKVKHTGKIKKLIADIKANKFEKYS